MDDFAEAFLGFMLLMGIALGLLLFANWIYSAGERAGLNAPVKLETITKASELCNGNGGLLWVNTKEMQCVNYARFYWK